MQYAAVMGIKKDLKLAGNEFSNVATWVFIAYLIAEVPNGEWLYLPSWHLLGGLFNTASSSPLSLYCQCIFYRQYPLPNGSVEMFSFGELQLPPPLAPEAIRVCWQLEFSLVFLKLQWDHP